MWRCVVLLSVCSACGDSGANASLADLPGLQLHVGIFRSSDDGPTKGYAVIRHDGEAFRAAHDGECAVVDIAASFDGSHASHIDPGGRDDFNVCGDPSVYFELATSGDTLATLRIADDSLAIEATFSPEQLAPHYPTLRSSSEWRFGGGDAVVLGWSHPQDLIDNVMQSPVTYVDPGAKEGLTHFTLDAQFVGDEIRFTIPDPPPLTGNGAIVFAFGYVRGVPVTCTGATECTIARAAEYQHTVEIVP